MYMYVRTCTGDGHITIQQLEREDDTKIVNDIFLQNTAGVGGDEV